MLFFFFSFILFTVHRYRLRRVYYIRRRDLLSFIFIVFSIFFFHFYYFPFRQSAKCVKIIDVLSRLMGRSSLIFFFSHFQLKLMITLCHNSNRFDWARIHWNTLNHFKQIEDRKRWEWIEQIEEEVFKKPKSKSMRWHRITLK